MIFTWVGAVVLFLAALLLRRGDPARVLALLWGLGLFGGSAALLLPALGGATITPAYFALILVIPALALTQRRIGPEIAAGARENIAFAFYAVYAAATAFILPRLFAGAVDVVPMQAKHLRFLLETKPLDFSTQNITTAVYLIGSLIGALIGYLAGARLAPQPGRLVNLLVVVGWAYVGTGVLSLVLNTPGLYIVYDTIRNGSYAQLSQEAAGLVRIAGFFPETSTYAAAGIPFLVGLAEAWFRNLSPNRTGPAALAVLAILVMSTSSTAYGSLAVAAALIVLRVLLFPGSVGSKKLLQLGALLGVAVALVLVALLALPSLSERIMAMLQDMTVNKAASSSGQQRRFWALQGWTLFLFTKGLGAGAGSFRSSSFVTAVLGSTGVIGAFAFIAYLGRVLQPLRRSTFSGSAGAIGEAPAVGAAFAWAAMGAMIPAVLSSPTPDPGLMFGIFAGLAVVLRRPARAELR